MNRIGRSYNSIRNISVGIVCQIITMILAFATRTIFVRLLGAEYTGVSGLFSNILNFLSLAELGIGNVLLFSLYEPLKDENKEKIRQYIQYFRKLYNYIAIGILLIGVSFIPLLPYIISDSTLSITEIRLYYILYLLNSVCSYIAVDKITLIQADQKIYLKTITSTVSTILMYICMIVFLFWKKSFLGYLIIQVVFTLGQNIFLNVISKRMYPYLRGKTELPSYTFRKNIVSNIKATFLYKISGVVINYTDNILISMMFGVVIVGYYSNYYMLISYIMTFIGYITTGIAGSLGNFNASNDSVKSYSMFRNLLYLYNLIAMFCVACYLNIVQGFVTFWLGQQYIMEYGVVLSILFSFYITYVIQPVVMYRESMGMFIQIKYVLVMTAIINIVLSVVFGKVFGVVGIIVATGVSKMLTVAWYEPKVLFKEKFHKTVSVYWKQQLHNCVVNLMIIVTSFFLCSFFPNEIYWLFVKIIITIVIALGFEVLFMRKTEEFKWIVKKISEIIVRKR